MPGDTRCLGGECNAVILKDEGVDTDRVNFDHSDDSDDSDDSGDMA